MLRWLDRYPVNIETKGSGTVLKARRVWITSNVDPRDWYKEKATEEQIAALLRRMSITYCPFPMYTSGSRPDDVISECSLTESEIERQVTSSQ